ncbi:hypothetical protein TNCV_2562191 [Trichonephila clavipes]|uniref:Uncharacterized protein n=1 Tax=Trichonephila clavipes TaxID=2585209 RepID=A0A8X6RB09_TRICX|nr:hypothetical protein TNCV_2562191 [Trichonephila clavipes]
MSEGLFAARNCLDELGSPEIQRIERAGHVVRINKDRKTKKVFKTQPNGTRRKDRSNLRWIDGLEKDLLLMRTKIGLTGRRLAWRRLLEKTQAHPGLSRQ